MYSDDESDSEYHKNGHHKPAGWPPERLFQHEERTEREAAVMILHRFREEDDSASRGANEFVTSRALLRDFVDNPRFRLPPRADWRRWRFFRFFLEIQGFHQGQLDLTARTYERYSKLKRTLLRFVKGFFEMAGKERRHSSSDATQGTTTRDTLSEYWCSFRSEWGISSTITMDHALSCISRTLEVMKVFREPIFQKLHLVDLPPEVLGLVYLSADMDDARALSATCRYLRDVGCSHIFQTRKLSVDFPYVVLALLEERTYPELPAEVVRHLFASASACLSRYQFLLGRPDICSRVTYLEVGSAWPAWIASITGDTCVSTFDELHGCLLDLFPRLRLLSFDAKELVFDIPLAQRFAEQPILSACNLHACSTAPALRECILNGSPNFPRSPLQILSVRIRDGHLYDSGSFWQVLALCPSLRLLHVYSFRIEHSDTAFLSPDPELSPHISPALSSLERMCLEGVGGALWLADWFQMAAALGTMRLTHLKLEFARFIHDRFMMDLLHSLHAGNAPLQVLALNGIMPASIDLVQTMVELFPDLVALTLFRRAGERPKSSGANRSRWPGALYEYAAPFRNFTRLRHFASNLYFDYDALSPLALETLLFGVGERDNDEYSFECVGDVARPFAAYCPTLQTFELEGYRGRAYTWLTISRAESGSIIMADTPWGLRFTPPDEIWDPDSYRPWTLPPHSDRDPLRPASYTI
ncbi:hypothetical protein AURDEDRAFT_160292 [Auricularia subglabra TFB-10046 SS5]|nr:hypothetical protein AURDEDRAFT_160292 [Auricularia subglabra TFB-10046 SS5]